ncbi:hypothetical protein [Dictyobacter aurantiacus]|uniref:Uncharacterized protein n=1 Tax=Dictyobacter aurantiacus TaxID=1936993 RepID=A0A401ZM02_9CHLR|nr:hypothetical protein [Dictyobacter aurantiacus]GCE07883.1 hypothetical protein KDAU_52120 [Dictyobacter aurantiacus]
MENEKFIKNNGEQTIRAGEDAKLAISRREFSLGLSGIMFARTVLEMSGHHEANTPTTKTTSPQKLEPQALDQAQYVLSGTAGSLWSPDSRHIAAFQENTVTLYNASAGTPELIYNQHTDEILTVKWSADSKYLAQAGLIMSSMYGMQ